MFFKDNRGLISKLSGVNLLTFLCSLDIVITMKQKLFTFVKWSSLHKSVSKFMPK
jgi:hypothetical protein